MTRRYADPVSVETVLRLEASDRPSAPHAFRWRGRRYLVREVLAYWMAAGVWWRPFTASRRAELPADRAVWRVETDTGGVFDLSRDTATGRWSVTQVHD